MANFISYYNRPVTQSNYIPSAPPPDPVTPLSITGNKPTTGGSSLGSIALLSTGHTGAAAYSYWS